MSKLTYVLQNNTNGPVTVGFTSLQPAASKTVTVDSDSPDDTAISAAVAAGSISVTSVTFSSPLQSPERKPELQFTTQTIAYAATITPDVSLGNILNVGALTGAMTIAAPTNPQYVGQRITFLFVQGGAGTFVITWNAIFKKAADGAAGAAGTVATKSFVWNGTNWVQDGGALAYA